MVEMAGRLAPPLAVAALVLGLTVPASAQIPGLEEWADAVAASARPPPL